MADRLYVVAKTIKTGYDETMRKVFVFIFSVFVIFLLCFSVPKTYAVDALPPCARWDANNGKCTGVMTAIGIIDTEPSAFVKKIFSVVLGMAGGIALILIMLSGYKFMMSRGNPEAVKSASEGLTSAIIGLLFIIFSFVILQIVGVDILQIPGFE